MRLCHGLAASSVPVSVKEVFNKETFFFTLLYLGAHTQQYFYISIHPLFACQISKGVCWAIWITYKPSTNLYHNKFFSIKQPVSRNMLPTINYNSREELLFAVVLVRG